MDDALKAAEATLTRFSGSGKLFSSRMLFTVSAKPCFYIMVMSKGSRSCQKWCLTERLDELLNLTATAMRCNMYAKKF